MFDQNIVLRRQEGWIPGTGMVTNTFQTRELDHVEGVDTRASEDAFGDNSRMKILTRQRHGSHDQAS